MQIRECNSCGEYTPEDAFRKGRADCVWCQYGDMEKRAKARYLDKKKSAQQRLHIEKADFLSWYTVQRDECAYCGLTFPELKRLRLRKGKGYCVSWDIDYVEPKKGYTAGNLALSCFVCNMAKGNTLSIPEMRVVGSAVLKVWRARLQSQIEIN